MDYAVLNEKINALARELVTLDTKKDASRIKTIRNKIASDMFSSLTENKRSQYGEYGSELFFYPLIKRLVAVDVFIDAVYQLLKYDEENGCWGYDSEKGSFISALRFLLDKRMITFEEKNRKNINLSLDKKIGEDEDISFGDTVAGSETVEEEVVRKSLSVAAVLTEYEKMIHKYKNKKIYLRSFFTFDTTKAVKRDGMVARTACKYNDSIFPYMELKLLEYLMVGSFWKMLDILRNMLRDTIDLEKRREIISCYTGVSPTIITDNDKIYKNIRKELLGNEGLLGYNEKKK